MDEQKNLTSHEKKELKKEQRGHQENIHTESKVKKESSKKIKNYTIAAIVVILIALGGYYFIIKPINEFKPFTSSPVHWHANFEVYLCGVRQDFTNGFDFEKNRLGSHILHSHNDNIIHIEGQIPKKEDIAIGNFFDKMRIPFSPEYIIDKKNGDLCANGQAGKVHMYVNDKENFEFRNFIPNPCDDPDIKNKCDRIDIKFE